ncbi:hypothetical protein KIPB_012150, partial [Kipferlia bialata]|eukprot:g12150.t1
MVRMQTSRNLRTNNITRQRKEIAALLSSHKFELAKIKCDEMIREECFVEAYDLLETHLQRIQASLHLIDVNAPSPTPPPAMAASVRTVVWAAPYAENKDMMSLRNLVGQLYGQQYLKTVDGPGREEVDYGLQSKLTHQTSRPQVLSRYLAAIAEASGVEYDDPLAHTPLTAPPVPPGQTPGVVTLPPD